MKAPKFKHSPSSSNEGTSSEPHPIASTSAHTAGQPYPSPSKILACVACRNSKVKCTSDGPEQCKRCLDHGLTCIRPEYQRLKRTKEMLARFQQEVNSSSELDAKPPPVPVDEADQPLPSRPFLPQESPTALFNNAFYGKSAQLLSNIHIVRPDVGKDWDPVSVGIMDLETSEALFKTFMDKLEALLSFFDRRIHTYQYIRSHSCLLFTTMCWLAATVSDFPEAPRIMANLKHHIDDVLLPVVYCQNLRSVELVQAFLMLAAYLRPSPNPSEDQSWTLLGHAIRVATDLDMHSRVLSTAQQHPAPSSSTQPSGAPHKPNTTEPAAAHSEASKRQEVWHQRNRERVWMHIWLHEASSSQYTGRVSLLSKDPIVESSRGWHLHPEALHTDVVFVALIELRSQLSQNKELFRLLSSRAGPSSGVPHSNASSAASKAGQPSLSAEADSSWIWHYLDRCNRDLSSWEKRWVIDPVRSASHPRPLRFELGSLYICYARMQLLSLPLQWPTLAPSVTTHIVSDLHSVSIRYLEDFLERTSPQRLAYSYNSICVTATYAVVIALKLTKLALTYSFINSARIIELASRVSAYLREGGNWTAHQNGSSLSYARYIDQLLNMESTRQADQINPSTPAAERGAELYSPARTAFPSTVLATESYSGGYTNGLALPKSAGTTVAPTLSHGDPPPPPGSALDCDRQVPLNPPPSLQRGPSNVSHPLRSPRTIYTATPASDTGLFSRIPASPNPVQPSVPGPTTPSSHFPLPPGLPATVRSGSDDQVQYTTAPGVETGHTQWSFLANDTELFAWARSFLNNELDLTAPDASLK